MVIMQESSKLKAKAFIGEQIYRTDHKPKRDSTLIDLISEPSSNDHLLRCATSFETCATQTSKTILQLAQQEMCHQFPDSLENSPGAMESELIHPFARRASIDKYINSSKPLTDSFLETRSRKSKSKSEESVATECQPGRARFLQQTSPLMKFMEHKDFKSQSFTDFNVESRFKITTVQNQPPKEEEIIPVRYYCQGSLKSKQDLYEVYHKSKRSNSFMSPTIASTNKYKGNEIVPQLLPAMRRGRSSSPKKSKDPKDPDLRIPYIDVIDGYSEEGQGEMKCESKMSLDWHSKTMRDESLETASTNSMDGALYQALSRLKEPDWNTSLRGLADVVEICRVVDMAAIFPHMITINQRLIELLKSPRSHVSRTACQAAGHLFEYVKDTRRPEFDEIVDTLLQKTADSNKFIRHDANLALDCMVTHIPLWHAIRSLTNKGPSHKNSLVRTAVARLVICAVVIYGVDNLLENSANENTRRRIFTNMVRFLSDKSLETRKFGERLYKQLQRNGLFETYLRKYIEPEESMRIKKAMKTNALRH